MLGAFDERAVLRLAKKLADHRLVRRTGERLHADIASGSSQAAVDSGPSWSVFSPDWPRACGWRRSMLSGGSRDVGCGRGGAGAELDGGDAGEREGAAGEGGEGGGFAEPEPGHDECRWADE